MDTVQLEQVADQELERHAQMAPAEHLPGLRQACGRRVKAVRRKLARLRRQLHQ